MEFLSLAVVGAAVSVLMQWVKKYVGDDKNSLQMAMIVVSVVIGSVYFFLVGTPAWEAILSILATATTVYEYVIKKTKVQ